MKQFTYHTVHKTILGDLHTPVSTYLKVRDSSLRVHRWNALSRSENNRSFTGLRPLTNMTINHGKAAFTFPDGSIRETAIMEPHRVNV